MKTFRPVLSLLLALTWAVPSAPAQITASGPDPKAAAPSPAASAAAWPSLKFPASGNTSATAPNDAASALPKAPPPPADPAAAFAAGLTAYGKGDFSAARDDFLAAARTATSPALEINLGNAYYENADFGQAILHYLRALALEPRNPAARANLDLARQAANITVPGTSRLQRLAASMSVGSWTWMATCCGWAALFLLFLPRLYRWRGAMPWLLFAASVAMTGLALAALAGWHWRSHEGVVLQADAQLKFSPTAHSQAVGLAQAGEVATMVEKSGGYYLVVTADGHRGWIAGESYQPVWE